MKKSSLILGLFALLFCFNAKAQTTVNSGQHLIVNALSYDPDGYIVHDSAHLSFRPGMYQFFDYASIEIYSQGFLSIYGGATLTSLSITNFWQGILVHGDNGATGAPNLPVGMTPEIAIYTENIDGRIKISNAVTGIKFLDDIVLSEPASGISHCRSMLGNDIDFLQCQENSLFYENNSIHSNVSVFDNCYFFSNQPIDTLIDHVYIKRLHSLNIENSEFDCKHFQRAIYLRQADMNCMRNLFTDFEFGIYHSHSSAGGVSFTVVDKNEFITNTPFSRAMRSEHSTGLQFTSNDITATDTGSYGLNLWNTNSVYAYDNTVSVKFYGLNSQGGVDNKYISNNIISKNTGIRSRLSTAPIIIENKILMSGLGSKGIDIQLTPGSRIELNYIEGTYLETLAAINLLNTGSVTTNVRKNRLIMAQDLLRCEGHNLGLETCSNKFESRAQYAVHIFGGVGIDDQGTPTSGSENDMSLITLGWGGLTPIASINNQGTFNTSLRFYASILTMPTLFFNANEVLSSGSGCGTLKTELSTEVIEEVQSSSSIVGYPNPIVDNYTIEANGQTIEEVVLYNIKGSVVISRKGLELTTLKLNVENIERGTYILLIKTDTENVRKRLIKL